MTLFSVRGIPIRLHWSFLLGAVYLIAREALSGGVAGATTMATLGGALFGTVLLHELGHAMMARHFGIPTRSITLYPFGGIAALQMEPRRPAVELMVALAGPAVNVGLAILGGLAMAAGLSGAGWFTAINVGMAVFNLLPAYPMDGGRVLRAWWSLGGQHPVVATLAALRLSRWFAWGFVALGVVSSPSLLLVGLFLLVATRGERLRWEAIARSQYHPARTAWVATPPRVLRRLSFDHPVA